MNIKDLPWGMIGKIAGAALGAAGLVGTGYVAAPKTTPQQIACEASTITIPLKVYINGQEIRKAK